MSNEYIGAIVILLVSILKLFKIDLGNEQVTAIVTGLVAVFVAYKRYKRGDISMAGVRKI